MAGGFFNEFATRSQAPGTGLPRCGACGLHKRCQSPKMKPYGKGRRRVLVVGEAPGSTEDEEGRPFVGMAGDRLRATMDQIGADLDLDAVVTNSLVCHPPNNQTPSTEQIGHCHANLRNVISRFKPDVVVTLGSSALRSVLTPYWGQLDTLERWVGWCIPGPDHWICPTYHPSYLLRSRSSLLDRLFRQHLEAAFALEGKPPKQPNWDDEVELVYDVAEVPDKLREMDVAGNWVAVDYETNCLKPEYPDARIYSCAVSDGETTISYPWKGDAIDATYHFLRSKNTYKIASNLKMEERWSIRHVGTRVRNWGWDTMLASHCLDNRPGICGLKFQAWVRLGVPSYNDKIEPYLFGRGWYNRIHFVEPRDLLLYGGKDALFEWKLAMLQREDMGLE